MTLTINYDDFLMLIALGYTLLLCVYFRFARSMDRMRQNEHKQKLAGSRMRGAFPVKQS